MSKPEWLIEAERKKGAPRKEFPKCCLCIYYGKAVKETKHKSKERVSVHECDIHLGCYNTKYSYACSDWIYSHDLDFD